MNCLLFLQDGLHDLYEELLPNAFCKIRRLQRCMRILSCKYPGVSLYSSFSGFARHCSWHRNFQLPSCILNSFFELLFRWINEVNTAQSSSVIKLRFLDGAIFVFLFVALLQTFFSISLATSNQALMSFVSLSIATRTMCTCTHLEGFSSK